MIESKKARNTNLYVSLFTSISMAALWEIHTAVNVFNDQNGPIGGGEKKLSEVRVPHNVPKLEVKDVKLQVISHGSDQAGFASPRRTIEQVATFPCPPNSLVKLPPLNEPVQVLYHRILQLRLHRQRLERGRMLQVDGVPFHPAVAVGGVESVHLQHAFLVFHLLRLLQNEGQVAVQHHFLVLLREAQLEQPLFGSHRDVAAGVVVGVVLLGLGTDESPLKAGAVEAVHHLLTLF